MTAAEHTAPSAPSLQILAGTLVTDGSVIEDGLLAIDGDRIAYSGPAADFDAEDFPGFATAIRHGVPTGHLILPGLVDVHCHGGDGGDFPTGEEESARKAAAFLHRSGTTTFMASMVTAPREDLLRGIELYVKLADEGLVGGIHLEGPFLSHAKAAHRTRTTCWIRTWT